MIGSLVILHIGEAIAASGSMNSDLLSIPETVRAAVIAMVGSVDTKVPLAVWDSGGVSGAPVPVPASLYPSTGGFAFPEPSESV